MPTLVSRVLVQVVRFIAEIYLSGSNFSAKAKASDARLNLG